MKSFISSLQEQFNLVFFFSFAESREALEHAIIVKRVSWPTVLHDDSEPNTTDNDVLEQAGPSNITIINSRDSNVSVIFVNVCI